MPSLLRHARSYSFPPCIDNVDFATSPDGNLPDIDEDPFSHFLTPVNEEDDPSDGLSLSAGIVVPDGPRTSKSSKFASTVADKWARYVRTNHVELHNRYHEDDEESFMQLDDDRLLDTPQTVSQLSGPPTPRIVITEPTRGRAQELVTRKARRRQRTSRTLSGQRHSWREPSPDLFTVEESEEEDYFALRRHKSKKAKQGAERQRLRNEVVEKSKL
ncbi:hypothetical protein BDV96DRAFT_647572 [Lophiotrema nucula]|uniref:Uncharacterized protein n=1 Tax=Lophiotrema nucula TaxID=690887 RepID=A0A6A5Z4R3_9PLEO|nr:hypothetical protein BDV96DRAFT_647572 [Lophiotrema nucula]